ncbi:hypothetical protein NL442_13745, partial [Klebsiella pneumoniae]|nr:hypothetical protein [Klebsiella pneumoniae]
GTVCVVGKMRDLILQLSKSSIYSTKPQLTVRAVPEADLAYCQVSVFTGSRSARLGISIIEY